MEHVGELMRDALEIGALGAAALIAGGHPLPETGEENEAFAKAVLKDVAARHGDKYAWVRG